MQSNLHVKSIPATVTLVCALLGGLAKIAQADEPFVQWASSFSNLNSALICPAPGGGFLSALSAPGNNGVIALVKFDGDGRLVASLPSPIRDLSSLRTDTSGAIYCSGYGGTNRDTFSVAKLNPAGTLVWQTEASPPLSGLYSGARSLVADASGNVCALGVSQGPVTIGNFTFDDGNGLLLCKFDKVGQVVWAKRILDAAGVTGTYSQASPATLDLDANGNIIFSGWLDPGTLDFLGTTVYPGATRTGGWGDGYIAKCDPNGNLLWVHVGNLHVGGVDWGYCRMGSAVDQQGNTYFLESSEWLGKLDPSGTLLWSREYPGAELSFGRGIAIDASGGVVFGGVISGTVVFDGMTLRFPSSDAQGFFLAKSDPSGNIQWAIAGGSAAADSWAWVGCNNSGDTFVGTRINAAGSFDGIALPSRPDVFGQIFVAARITERPQLRITNAVGSVTVTYPAKATNYVLEAATPVPTISWSAVTNTPTVSGRDRRVQLPLTGPAKFFRLRKP